VGRQRLKRAERMPRAGRHCSIALAAAAALAPAGASGFTIDTEQWFGPETICLSARNLRLDAIAEYVDNDGRIVWRAGSWLGRDGRYLLRPPASDGLSIRFRALEDRPVEPQDVALEACPDPMPADAVDALTAAINARLADYLGEHGGDEAALPDHFRQAIEALGDAGLSSWKAVAHFEYASYARATDRLAEASDHYRHALAGFADTGDPPDVPRPAIRSGWSPCDAASSRRLPRGSTARCQCISSSTIAIP